MFNIVYWTENWGLEMTLYNKLQMECFAFNLKCVKGYISIK